MSLGAKGLSTKTLKAYRGSGGAAPSILSIDIGGSFAPRPLYLRGYMPTRRQKRPRACLENLEKRNTSARSLVTSPLSYPVSLPNAKHTVLFTAVLPTLRLQHATNCIQQHVLAIGMSNGVCYRATRNKQTAQPRVQYLKISGIFAYLFLDHVDSRRQK